MDEGFKKKKFQKPQVEVIDEKDSQIAKSLIQEEKLSAKSQKFINENINKGQNFGENIFDGFQHSDSFGESSFQVFDNKSNSKTLKMKITLHFFLLNLFYLNIMLIQKIMLCYYIKQTYKSNDHFFSAIWELGIIFSFISIFGNSLFQIFFKNSNIFLYRIHNYFILQSINNFFGYIILYILGNQLLNIEFNFLIFLPQLMISLFACFNQKTLARKILYLTLLLEWIQNILAILNFKWEMRWTLILVYYESLASLQFLVTFCLFVGFIPFIVYVYSNKKQIFAINYSTYFFILILGNYLYFVWNGLFYFNFLNGIISLLRNDLVYNNILLKAVNTYMPLGIFLIFIINFFSVMIFLLVLTSRSKEQEIIKLYNKLEKIEFKYISIQEKLLDDNKNQLQNRNDDNVIEEENLNLLQTNSGRTKCLMCKIKYNKIIIMPCGHSGFCKQCFKTYWKSNKQCPICSNHIEQIILFYFNKENTNQKPIPQYLNSLRSNTSEHKESLNFDEQQLNLLKPQNQQKIFQLLFLIYQQIIQSVKYIF